MRRASDPVREELWESDYLGDEFRMWAEAMPQLVWAARPDGKVDFFNRRWLDYTGFKVGDPEDNSDNVVHPDEYPDTVARWNEAVLTSQPYEMEYRLRKASDGRYRWFLGRAVPIRDSAGNVIRWIGTATDIDELKRAREGLTFMVEAGNALSASLNVQTICDELARLAVGHFADWCFVALRRDDTISTVAMQHRDKERLHLVARARDKYPPQAGDPLVKAIEENESFLVDSVTEQQIEEGARDPEHLKLLRLLDMQSVMIVPIASPDGETHGAISMISTQSSRTFNQTDLDVAKVVATRAAIAIDNAKMYQAERRAVERLRFLGNINDLLLETSDLWGALERVADTIAHDLADGCTVAKITGEALRTEVVSHRNPEINAAIAGLRGQRSARPEVERDLIERLNKHEVIVFADDSLERMKARTWPYLAAEITALNARTTALVPIHSRNATYGVLVAYYSTRTFDVGRDLPLLGEIAARTAIAFERAETLERERKIATTLQRASLPSLIPQPNGLRFDTFYAPAGDEGEVGGDWYDAIELDDGTVVLSVGDVTGRGIQAAAIMSKVRHAMGMAPLHEPDPAKILDSAEWFLKKRYADAIVTAFVGCVSLDRRTLHFANAGHPLPLLRRNDRLIEVVAHGLPLGLRRWAAHENSETLTLEDGDLLVLFTDGLIEATRDWVEGESRLRDVVRSEAVVASASPAKLIARSCLPSTVHDDVAILTVLVGKPPVWAFTAEDARAAADARSHFVAFLQEHNADADYLYRAELVFGELLGNVVRHAPGPVEISLCESNGSSTLHVIDSGKDFDFESSLPGDILSEIGRGLFIVRQIAADLRFEHVPNCGNHIAVTL
jgi:PAS domain S-box-containing protein